MTPEKILQPIATIKMIRGLTNCGLKDGNDLVFALRDGDISAYTKALEKIRAEMYSPDTAELMTRVEALTHQVIEQGEKLRSTEYQQDSIQRQNVELRASIESLNAENDRLTRELRQLQSQSPVKAPLIDRELAKSLIRCLDRGEVHEALDLILEAALPTEVGPIHSCGNCDPGSNEEACNTCHNFSNWREDTCPF